MIVGLKDIQKSYQGRKVLDIDLLNFEEGKIYAVVGPNGSGKSTLLRIMAGIEAPDKGEICFPGEKKDIAYMPQKPYMFDMKVIGNVVLGIRGTAHAAEIAREALRQVGMEEFENTRACTLSGGEQQRVALARTMVLGKPMVLLDEPSSAVDITAVKLIESYIKSAADRGTTIIFSTHSPSQALRVADETVFILGGKVVEKGGSVEVIHSPKRLETREFLKNWRI